MTVLKRGDRARSWTPEDEEFEYDDYPAEDAAPTTSTSTSQTTRAPTTGGSDRQGPGRAADDQFAPVIDTEPALPWSVRVRRAGA